MNPQRGFTLIEVLVALLIMALAFAAMLRASGLAAENSINLRQRMLAGWMAENRMAWLQSTRVWPALGRTSGNWSEDGRNWVWQQQVSVADQPRMRRIELRIMMPDQPGYVLADLVALVALRPE
jgi:general secretion pathway protein I